MTQQIVQLLIKNVSYILDIYLQLPIARKYFNDPLPNAKVAVVFMPKWFVVFQWH
jgi:hypothetical protein